MKPTLNPAFSPNVAGERLDNAETTEEKTSDATDK